MDRTHRPHALRGVLLVAISLLLLAGRGAADEPKKAKAIFDKGADARAAIAEAVAKAAKENTRVLVMYGANWCGWCHKLHDLFKKDRAIARVLLYEYELVLVDVGRFDRNTDIAKGYGAKIDSGVPYLTVLDAGGKVLANQETGSLEKGKEHDPERVKSFLDKWVAKAWDAEEIHGKALARATREKKRLLVHLGAPW